MDISWKSNRQSLINIISFIVFMGVLAITGGGFIIGAIAGIVVWGGLSWLLNKILPKSKEEQTKEK